MTHGVPEVGFRTVLCCYAAKSMLRCTLRGCKNHEFVYNTRLRIICEKFMSNNTKKPEADYSFKHEDDRPAKRTCLSCQTKFVSEGWGNRLCQPCRSRSSASMAA